MEVCDLKYMSVPAQVGFMCVYLNFALAHTAGLHMVVCQRSFAFCLCYCGGSVPGFACSLFYERNISGGALNKHLLWPKTHLMSAS